jgi:hypothetical protein
MLKQKKHSKSKKCQDDNVRTIKTIHSTGKTANLYNPERMETYTQNIGHFYWRDHDEAAAAAAVAASKDSPDYLKDKYRDYWI